MHVFVKGVTSLTDKFAIGRLQVPAYVSDEYTADKFTKERN